MHHSHHPTALRRRTWLLAAAFAPLAAHADPLPPYRDEDGSLRIEGSPDMLPLVRRWNQLFAQAHSGERLLALGTGADSAVSLLTHDMTLVAAMDRPIHPLEKVAYGKINNASPLEIQVGYGRVTDHDTPASSLAVYLHRSHPLNRIPRERLAGLLGQGLAGGDVTTWNQLGLSGPQASRRIHLYGLPAITATGALVQRQLLKGHDFAAATEWVDTPEALWARIAADPWALGVAPAGRAPAAVKRIALEFQGRVLQGSAEDIQSGLYPLSRPLTLALRRRKDQPLHPLAVAYLRLALSPQGQAALATQCVALTPSQIETELRKLA